MREKAVKAIAHDQMHVIGHDRQRVDGAGALGCGSRKAAGDGPGLNAGEPHGRVSQSPRGGEAAVRVMPLIGERTCSASLRGGSETHQVETANGVGPRAARIMESQKP